MGRLVIAAHRLRLPVLLLALSRLGCKLLSLLWSELLRPDPRALLHRERVTQRARGHATCEAHGDVAVFRLQHEPYSMDGLGSGEGGR